MLLLGVWGLTDVVGVVDTFRCLGVDRDVICVVDTFRCLGVDRDVICVVGDIVGEHRLFL